MRIKTTYIADDGTKFMSKSDCVKYEEKIERIRNDEIQKAMYDLDEEIWKRYYPDFPGEKLTDLRLSGVCLKIDIEAILADKKFNMEKEAKYIFDLIKNNKYGNEILSKYINQNDIMDAVNIKTDFCTALREEKDVTEIAHKLGYGLSSSDLRSLAALHKENKCRKKIEELLTSCNFHYECSKFANKEYNDFL